MDSEPISSLDPGRQSEVRNLEVVLSIQQDVLGLQVAVDNAGDLVKVFDRGQQLFEVVTGKQLAKSALGVLNFDVRE